MTRRHLQIAYITVVRVSEKTSYNHLYQYTFIAFTRIMIASRSILSGGCRVGGVTRETSRTSKHRYPASSSTTKIPLRTHHVLASSSSNTHRGASAAAAAATGACVMCKSVRMTAACSATTAVNSALRRKNSNSGAASDIQNKYFHSTSNINYHVTTASSAMSIKHSNIQGVVVGRHHHFGNGLSSAHPLLITASAKSLPAISSSRASKPTSVAKASSFTGATIHSSSSASSTTPNFLLEATFGGLTGHFSGSSSGTINESTTWTIRELTGAIAFASAVTTGSLFLGPFDKLRGNEGGGGSSSGGGGGNNNKYEHSYETAAKEKEEENNVSVGIATAPTPYEVSEGMFLHVFI